MAAALRALLPGRSATAGCRRRQQQLVPAPALRHRSPAAAPRPFRRPPVVAVARPLGPGGLAHEEEEEAVGQPSPKELLAGYYRLLRGWNALPSGALVLLGAWAGAGKTALALQHVTVWFMAWASGAVALASCAINDYFDFCSGVDALNCSDKPIPSGLIAPDRALLCACALYICLLALACVVPNAGVRLIIAASSALTVLYTPLLKHRTLLKNCVVAATIGAAPLAGALAAGAAGPGLRAVLAPSSFLFMLIMSREIMMDIQDRRGDGDAGVRTLPVVLGPRAAAGICLSLLATCAALAARAALYGGGLAWLWASAPAWEPAVRATALAAAAWVLSPYLAATLAVLRSGFGREQVSHAISVAMKSAGLGTLLLAILV